MMGGTVSDAIRVNWRVKGQGKGRREEGWEGGEWQEICSTSAATREDQSSRNVTEQIQHARSPYQQLGKLSD